MPQNIGVYVIGIVIALIAARIMKSTLFKGEGEVYLMELPPYRMPTVKSMMLHMWDRSKMYLQKAGTIILATSIILYLCNTYPEKTEFSQDYDAQIRVWMSADINPRFTYPDLTFTNANNPNTIVHIVELTPGWNRIEVPAEVFKTPSYDSNAKLVMLSGSEALAAVGAFCIYFDRGELHEIPEEFYLDNVRAYLAD